MSNKLERILDELIEKFGLNEGYPKPTISWSEENMLYRFGEYQYWKNHIYISRLLNSDNISETDLAYVIFHELTHQIVAEHNNLFYNRMNVLPKPENIEERLNQYLDICELLPAKKQQIQLSLNDSTMLCKLFHDKEDLTTYLNYNFYFEHCIVGNMTNGVPKGLTNNVIPQVIFIVEQENQYYAVGWAKNVKFCSNHQVIDYSDLGIYDLEFDFVYKQKDGVFVCPGNAISIGSKNEFSKRLSKDGYLDFSRIDNIISTEIIQIINNYDSELEIMGYSDEVISMCSPICIDDNSLISVIKEEANPFRKVLLLNKLVFQSPSYSSYFARAEALSHIDLYDLAIEDYRIADTYLPDRRTKEKKDIKGLIDANKEALKRFSNVIHKE